MKWKSYYSPNYHLLANEGIINALSSCNKIKFMRSFVEIEIETRSIHLIIFTFYNRAINKSVFSTITINWNSFFYELNELIINETTFALKLMMSYCESETQQIITSSKKLENFLCLCCDPFVRLSFVLMNWNEK